MNGCNFRSLTLVIQSFC